MGTEVGAALATLLALAFAYWRVIHRKRFQDSERSAKQQRKELEEIIKKHKDRNDSP
jgi:hypothetical protein